MTKRVQFYWLLFSLALMFGLATLGARAQGTAQQPGQQPMTQPQSPNQTPTPQQPPDQAQPNRNMDTPTQSPSGESAQEPQSGQTFTGTIVKAGDKFVLQDTSGTNYDIDHQDIVQKYEGKHVRVHGTLDSNGKLIHIQ